MEILYKLRHITFNDWATLLFFLCFVIIAINRNVYSVRFSEFTKLAFSDRYAKTYKDSSNILNSFTVSMLVVQLIALSFFILLFFNQFEIATKNNGILFVQIITFLSVFIFSKFLFEKIIAVTFAIEEFVDQFNLQKVIYRTYIGFLLLPITLVLFYNPVSSSAIFYIIGFIILVFNVLLYITIVKKYQNFILRKIFYFILYLCAFEIAPYYFIYYWIVKN
ncbi:DUF4271 domain-containing protein [Flavobacterium sp.]|uniref:DUF4271 domain-containing protein n=1 Tax=Flavobacterium sp. TaxID=239 RepID=UPI003528B3DF